MFFLFIPKSLQAAPAADYYRETLEFDAQGNLIMTTRDFAATSSVTYRTIGWTIKRYNIGIFDSPNQCAFIPMVSSGPGRPDPTDSRYTYNYFYCDKDTIYEAIGRVSPDWQTSLYQNGGTVYLDGIMTVCHNGVPLGTLYDSMPSYEGEVYFTFDGIANARNWRDVSGLYTHFNKQVSFPANPSFLRNSTAYQVLHFQAEPGQQPIPLSRYGHDRNGILTDWVSEVFTLADFSPYDFRLHHSETQITYYNGTSQTLVSEEAASVTLNNQEPIEKVLVLYYYVRISHLDSFNHSYHLKNDALDITASGHITASNKNPYTYQVEKGIPSDSLVNLSTALSPFACQIHYLHYYGKHTCSIPVETTYQLAWTDSSGAHQETVTLSETYYADRSYSFYIIADYSLYVLESALFFQDALENPVTPLYNSAPALCQKRLDGEAGNHFFAPDCPVLSLDGGIIYGNGSRPSLPYGKQQAQAEAAIPDIQVKNDFFQVGTAVFSNDTLSTAAAQSPVLPDSSLSTSLKKEDVLIPGERANKDSYKTTVLASYKCINNNAPPLTQSFPVNSIKVHTPVLCKAQISDDKKFNQQKKPDSSRGTLILGRNFQIKNSCSGPHVDLPGYGNRDYSEHACDIQALFPFPVYIENTYLEENKWHSISADQSFYLPTGVSEGNYEIQVRVLAKNTPSDIAASDIKSADYTEENANLDPAHTIAAQSLPVQVIGRLYDLTFIPGDAYRVGEKNQNGQLLGESVPHTLPATGCRFDSEIPFSITTVGNPPAKEDVLSLTPTFYYVNEKGGDRQPVNLYLLTSSDTLELYQPSISLTSASSVFQGSAIRNVPDKQTALKSVQAWNGSFFLPEPFLITPKETDLVTELEEKGSLSLKDSCFLQGGFLLVRFSITYDRQKLSSLDYLNTANAASGYCNMWQTEGFSYTRKDHHGIPWSFLDGDSLLFSLNPSRKVIQTH